MSATPEVKLRGTPECYRGNNRHARQNPRRMHFVIGKSVRY